MLSDHGAVVNSPTNQSTNPGTATSTTLATITTTTTTRKENNLNEMIADGLICTACNHLIHSQVCIYFYLYLEHKHNNSDSTRKSYGEENGDEERK